MHVLTKEPDWLNDPVEVICGAVSGSLTTRCQQWFGVERPEGAAASPPRPRGRTRPIGEKQRAQVRQLIEAGGMSYAEIADATNVSASTVGRIAARDGVGPGSGHHNRKHSGQ